MIIRPRLHFWQMLFVRHGAVLRKIWQPMLVLLLWSVAIVAVHRLYPRILPGHAPGPYTLLGIALSIFYSFRNNACYERWWEGRCQWGHLVATARNFARQTLILAPDERKRLITLAIAFCYALARHLRPGYREQAAEDWLAPAEQAAFAQAVNRPDAIVQLIGQRIAVLRGQGQMSDITYQLLDHTVQQFAAVQGACERIRSSPVPFSYNQLLQRTTFAFLLALPFGFLDILGGADIVAVMLIAYVFLGLDVLGDELEEPFGEQPNNLPVAALSRLIEIELRGAMGETGLPALPAPVNFVLM
jgi:putative membrane protein